MLNSKSEGMPIFLGDRFRAERAGSHAIPSASVASKRRYKGFGATGQTCSHVHYHFCLTAVTISSKGSKPLMRSKTKKSAVVSLKSQYQPRLIIKGPPEFIRKTVAQFEAIAQTRMGERLLGSLEASGKTVIIVSAAGGNESPPDSLRGAIAKGRVIEWKEPSGKKRAVKGTGAGSGTTIKYNPDRTRIGLAEAWQEAPPGIWLAHELIHADDAAYGRMEPEITLGVRHYELQAIGLPPYERKRFTENRLRAEWAPPQPARTSY